MLFVQAARGAGVVVDNTELSRLKYPVRQLIPVAESARWLAVSITFPGNPFLLVGVAEPLHPFLPVGDDIRLDRQR